MKKLALIAILFSQGLWGVSTLHATSAGADPFDFLFLDADARAVAMGGAYTALATDANSLRYNPAGLGRLQDNEATFMHNQYVQDIHQEYAALGLRNGLGFQLSSLAFGDVPVTTISQPQGTGASETLSDLLLGMGYGHTIGDALSLGGEVKYIRERVAGVGPNAVAFDLGAHYLVSRVRGLSLGLSAQNLGPRVRFQSEKEQLPQMIRGGLGYVFEGFGVKHTVSSDLLHQRTEGVQTAIGYEALFENTYAFRLGYQSRSDAGPGITVGAGWKFHAWCFDYAFVPFGELGNAHRVSIGFRWGSENAPRNLHAQKEPGDDDTRRTPENALPFL